MVGFVVIMAAFAVFMLPTIIAARTRHPWAGSVAVLNMLAGWTVFGWFAALALALAHPGIPWDTEI